MALDVPSAAGAGTTETRGRILRAGTQDAPLVAAVFLAAAALAAFPSIVLVAGCLWWTANTSAHNFIHRPFFSARAANAVFSLLLSAVMGVPQPLWRDRHLAHHAGRAWAFRWSPDLSAHAGAIAAVWAGLIAADPALFWTTYMPGWLAGLALCALQGHYEHRGGTTSHYGRLYNALCFNDGYHVEHHARPGVGWTCLPAYAARGVRSSRWPPILRWLDAVSLDGLERLVLHSITLQRFVLRTHRLAFARLLPCLPPVGRVLVVGGGLFPRTALILRDLLPSAQISIVDRDPDNLEAARAGLAPGIEFHCRAFTPSRDDVAGRYDLVVIPLAFVGDRAAIYRDPPAAAVLVHDWVWRRRGTSCIVSLVLFKRINLLTSPGGSRRAPMRLR